MFPSKWWVRKIDGTWVAMLPDGGTVVKFRSWLAAILWASDWS